MYVKALMVCTATWLTLCSTSSFSAALERSGQPIGLLFENDPQLEFAHVRVSPNASGIDTLGQNTGDVTQNYRLGRLGVKANLGHSLSGALILDQPWGANLSYSNDSVLYGGTEASADTLALTALVHKPISKTLGVFSGLRIQQAEGSLGLRGAIFGAFSGYNVQNKPDESLGYVAGFSYKKPALGLLFSLAYFSEIEHRLDANESTTAGSTTTTLTTPSAVNIDFRMGISPTTLLLASVRWVNWSEFVFTPESLPFEVANFEDDAYVYTLGVGRRFTSSWAGTLLYKHEPSRDNVNSLFSPSNGYDLLSSAAIYTFVNKTKLIVGLSYAELGDSTADIAGGNRVSFSGNESLAVGVRVNVPF